MERWTEKIDLSFSSLISIILENKYKPILDLNWNHLRVFIEFSMNFRLIGKEKCCKTPYHFLTFPG